jgi:Domain of unknown function (DUF5671)
VRTELNLVRRIYLLAVALVSLALGSASFNAVAVAVVDALIGIDAEVPLLGVAGIIVQMPIWAIHWTLAQRDANRSLAERGSLLRRTYLYVVMTAGLTVSAAGLSSAITHLAGSGTRDEIVESAIGGMIGLALWVYHRRVIVLDRVLCAETGLASTVRRIASYGPATLAALFALSAVTELATQLVRRIAATDIGTLGVEQTAWAIGTAIVSTAIWVSHHRGGSAFAGGVVTWPPIAGPPEDDRAIVPVAYRFVVLTVAIGSTMYGAAMLVEWILGLTVGSATSDHPFESALDGMVEACVFGSAWWLFRLASIESRFTTQAGKPRGLVILYRYLATVVGLCIWVSGLALLLTDAITYATSHSAAGNLEGAWRREASLVLVGVPLWLAYWRAPGHPLLDIGETGSRSRRGALYLVLLACALALLATGVAVAYAALEALVGRDVNEIPWWALVTTLLSFGIGGYHFTVLRADARRLSIVTVKSPDTVGGPSVASLPEDPTLTEWAVISGGRSATSVTWFGTYAEARVASARMREVDEGAAAWMRIVRTVPTTPADGPDQPA